MMTAHEHAAYRSLMSWIADPAGGPILADLHQRIVAGEFDDFLLDAVGQDHRRSVDRWQVEQLLMFTKVHSDLAAGKIGTVDVGLWDSPHADRLRQVNQEALNKLPAPFRAQVDQHQHGADSDGWLEWTEPIRVSHATDATEIGADGRPTPIPEIVMAKPGRVPLEIGFTKPSRTLCHIREGSGVARWPYHHEKVRIFLNMERVRLSEPRPYDDRSET